MQDGACKFTCDGYAIYAGFQFTSPNCSTTHRSKTLTHETWESLTKNLVSNGCCGTKGISACDEAIKDDVENSAGYVTQSSLLAIILLGMTYMG